jgi:hypothetical protein
MTGKTKKLLEMLKELTENRFFGRLEIIFNAGKIVHVKKEESLKLEE